MKKLVYLLALVLVFSCGENKKEEVSIPIEKETIKPEIADKEYVEKGKKIAMSSFGAMKGALMSSMKSGGVEKATNFCNINAGGLVDSLSSYYNVEIKRTSLQLRNPKNKPTEEESEILALYKEVFDSKSKPKPIIKRHENTVSFYAPIKLQGACIQCHGKVGNGVKEEDFALIKELYTDDQATGYNVDDFRGIWHITFKK